MEKNKTIEGICIDLSHEGLGIIKENAIPYFVPNVLPDERCKIIIQKEYKSYGYGACIERYNNSVNRMVPDCKYYGVCGGCDLRHLTYEYESSFKLKMVNETYRRIGHLDFIFKNIINAKDIIKYRNKVQIPFANDHGKVICGFYKKKSHNIVEIRECNLQTDLTTNIAIYVKNIMNDYKMRAYDENTKKGSLRHLLMRKNSNGDYMVVFIVNEYNLSDFKMLCDKVITRFNDVKSVVLNINRNNNNIILGDKSIVLYGDDYLEEDILGLKFKMSHKAFFQINHDQTELLYTKALELANIHNDDVVLDCYCGVGTISLLASKYAKKVYGIEIVEEAIKDAKMNALKNNINNCTFIVGPSEEEINNINDNIDVLIVDPPRKGLDSSLVSVLLNSTIKRIVYISCDVATMARDVSLLTQSYNIVDGSVVDLFPRTANVECVICLEKR